MAKKGLGKGLGAIFGEDVIKESEEEIAKAKAAVTDNRDGKSGELMVKMALICLLYTSYEEAAVQGFMAGVNAVMKIRGQEAVVLDRSQAYIGCLLYTSRCV